MKLTESQLRRIVREELRKVTSESLDYDPLGDGGVPFVGTGSNKMTQQKWKITKETRKFPGTRSTPYIWKIRAVATGEDSTVLHSTWWHVDDGSAEQEVHKLIRQYEKKNVSA